MKVPITPYKISPHIYVTFHISSLCILDKLAIIAKVISYPLHLKHFIQKVKQTCAVLIGEYWGTTIYFFVLSALGWPLTQEFMCGISHRKLTESVVFGLLSGDLEDETYRPQRLFLKGVCNYLERKRKRKGRAPMRSEVSQRWAPSRQSSYEVRGLPEVGSIEAELLCYWSRTREEDTIKAELLCIRQGPWEWSMFGALSWSLWEWKNIEGPFS